MIPKTVHYIWFGDNTIPTEYIKTWNILSKYDLKFWGNNDIQLWMNSPFFKYNWDLKKYAFCSDYARAWILYNYGGIYLDCDVSILDTFDKILNFKTYYGLESVYTLSSKNINGHRFTNAIMGCEQKDLLQKDFLDYLDANFKNINNLPIDIYSDIIKDKYTYKIVNNLEDAKKYSDLVLFDSSGFDKGLIFKDDYAICRHYYLNTWLNDTKIPKIIHYSWISGDELPEKIKKCIDSWKLYMPDWKYINWNDSNFDWNITEYTKKAREKKHWAYCADYARIWALYNYGGFYLDCDVKLIKSLEELRRCDRVLTQEIVCPLLECPEAAIMGFKPKDPLLKLILDFYETKEYIESKGNIDPDCLPHFMRNIWKEKGYKFILGCNIKDLYHLEDNNIKFLNVRKYFHNTSDFSFGEHLFYHTWIYDREI